MGRGIGWEFSGRGLQRAELLGANIMGRWIPGRVIREGWRSLWPELSETIILDRAIGNSTDEQGEEWASERRQGHEALGA